MADEDRVEVTPMLLREKIALAICNEQRRYHGFASLASLFDMKPHEYRDQLRFADAILTSISMDRLSTPQASPDTQLREALESRVVQAVIEAYDHNRCMTPPLATNIYTKEPVKAAFAALQPTPAPESAGEAGLREVLPDDVRRLVIAARLVAYESPIEPEALRELDQASEAFAARVPWDDEPNASEGGE